MKKDLDSVIRRLIKFLEVDPPSDEKLELLKREVSFSGMQNNTSVNKSKEIGPGFIRKGVVGDWRNHFSEEANKEWDEWIEEELEGSDFRFQFE